MDVLERVLIIGAVIAVWAIIIGVPILVIRRMRTPIERKFERLYAGLEIRKTPTPGDVEFEFHTYDGLIVYFTQTQHHGYGPPDDVRELLKRMHKYNCTHGLLCPGAIFIPLLSWASYKRQLRSVAEQ